ncbi:HTH_Tnp_Tc3_2 domain-containing protein [Trichonephila clavipes]|nr:HTH_Tnp_Tc3_2 domain-containing protein [Trichonephila clavipes]
MKSLVFKTPVNSAEDLVAGIVVATYKINTTLGILERFQDNECIERKSGQGRPRATIARGNHHLSIIARRNRGVTVSQLFRYLYAATGTRVLRMVVSKTLYERVLFARRPTRCLILAHVYDHLEWCRQHRD